MRRHRESLLPFVVSVVLCASGSAQSITEYSLPSALRGPGAIATGADGNLWFTTPAGPTARNAPTIGRVTTAGQFTGFPIPGHERGESVIDVISGPDGNVWFTVQHFDEGRASIGRITPLGEITTYMLASSTRPSGITVGPDGNLWFTEVAANRISRITTSGIIQNFPIPTPASAPMGITSGPDGNLWFTEANANQIARITMTGSITEFPIPTAPSGAGAITVGPDGNLWFTELFGNRIGRITTGGEIMEFPIPTFASDPADITAGPDGNLWFTELNANKIGRITPSGVITEFPIPTAGSGPYGITVGPDGNLWFTESSANKIGRITVSAGPAIDSRILPVVGSASGVGGSFFRTAVQLNNSTSTVATGRVVFHPSGVSGSGSDPALPYTLSPGQTQSFADLLPAMGRSGLGSADLEVTSGSVPTTTVRVFNDAGAAGTTGFTEEALRPEDALRPGQSGVLLLPSDSTSFRFNLGIRTLEAGASATLTLRDASGAVMETVSRAYPATYHEQQSASAFLGVTTLPPGGSISISVVAGNAIVYGATVDNTTGDPSLQIARAAP